MALNLKKLVKIELESDISMRHCKYWKRNMQYLVYTSGEVIDFTTGKKLKQITVKKDNKPMIGYSMKAGSQRKAVPVIYLIAEVFGATCYDDSGIVRPYDGNYNNWNMDNIYISKKPVGLPKTKKNIKVKY